MNTTLLGIQNAASRYNIAARWYKANENISTARNIIAATRNSESPLDGILPPLLGIRNGEITPLHGIISPLVGIKKVFSDEKNRLHRG